MKKIQTEKEILRTVEYCRRSGKKIVSVSGSFDILHPGHLSALREARSQGDCLIVLLNSDKSVRMYKGPARPIQRQKDRAEMLAALECVDFVVLFDAINPKHILQKIKPDVYCNDIARGTYCVERETVLQHNGRLRMLRHRSGYATSAIIKKILDVYPCPQPRAVFLDRDGIINLNKDGYIFKKKDFVFTPGVFPALRLFMRLGFKLVIVTNQSGIGRGYYAEKDVMILHQWMIAVLEKKGIVIDRIYYCPHVPAKKCGCRKPALGMIMRAVKDLGVSLNDSWLIGDDEKDMLMGREANIRTIRIGSRRLRKKIAAAGNYHKKNLLDAAVTIKTLLLKHARL